MCLTRPRAQFTDLPQEIRNNIVEYLHGYKQELASCALVHRSLTWAAQKELHHTLNFDWTPDTPDDNNRIESLDWYSNPTIASFVRHLELACVPHPDDDEVAWTVMARLVNVEHLEFSSRNYEESWNYITAEDRETLRKTFPNVKTLVINGDYFAHVEDFLFFLSAFPNVTSLKMDDVSFSAFLGFNPPPGKYPRQVIEGVPCPKLRSLDISYGINAPEEDEDVERLIKKWIEPLAQVAEPGFAFKWYDTAADDVEYFPPFVRALAPVLGSLEVALNDNASDVGNLGIDQCMALESVSFTSLCRNPDMIGARRGPQGDAWVLELLSQVTSPHMKKVTFGFSASKEEHLRTLDFERLVALLLRPPFAQTTIVLGVLDPYANSIEDAILPAKVMMRFMKLWETGRLEIGSRYGGPTAPLPGALLASFGGLMA